MDISSTVTRSIKITDCLGVFFTEASPYMHNMIVIDNIVALPKNDNHL